MADLRREYGIDLLDFWRGRLSFFELCAYLGGLDAETTTGRLIRNLPEDVEGWGLVPQLLGMVVDAIRGQWSEQPVDSVIPKALFQGGSEISQAKPELQPDRAAFAMFGSPQAFVATHTGK